MQEQSYLEFDLTLVLPLRYGMGFMLGGKTLSLYGPDTEAAFGHLGFTNIISWADPERQVTGALMTSGKPLVYPELYYLHDLMWRSARCARKTNRAAPPPARRPARTGGSATRRRAARCSNAPSPPRGGLAQSLHTPSAAALARRAGGGARRRRAARAPAARSSSAPAARQRSAPPRPPTGRSSSSCT